jgi:hypothetical protein
MIHRIQATDAMRHVTMTVEITGMKSFRARLWLSTWLILLAAWILQIGRVEFTEPEERR